MSAPAPIEDDFSRACRRHDRILALLQSYKGERITISQICDGLRIEHGSQEHWSLIRMLVKMLEYRKVSHDSVNCESVWWIEPVRDAEPPGFDLRHVKAAVRERVR